MIDVHEEHLLTLTQVAKELPNRPHASSIFRWWKIGVGGVRLETIVVGGRRISSREALQRFAERRTAAVSCRVEVECPERTMISTWLNANTAFIIQPGAAKGNTSHTGCLTPTKWRFPHLAQNDAPASPLLHERQAR